MFNDYKYSFILELEKKYESSFKLCTTNKIAVLPPILKKLGLVYYLAFLVIEEPKNNQTYKAIKRPIGIILINKNNGKETLYDMQDYEFCPTKTDFEISYFDIDSYPEYWPNRNIKNEEKYKVCLENLRVVAHNTNIIKKPNQQDYNNYISKIRSFFPDKFWFFYETLSKNEIVEVSAELEFDREKAKIDHVSMQLEVANKVTAKKELKKAKFLNFLMHEIFNFVKVDLSPSLKGKGSYTKLIFFNMLGEKIRDFKKNISSYENCYDPILSETFLKKNQKKCIENLQIEVVKLFSRATKNSLYKIVSVDTISKVLIIFLNCLLLEDMHKKIIKIFEDEIAECKDIFEEDIEKIQNNDAKEFLLKIYNSLCKDYYEIEEDNFSNIFFAYLSTFSIKPNLALIEVDD